MNRREEILRLWFDMRLQKNDSGISKIFSENVVYTESWEPEYHGCYAKCGRKTIIGFSCCIYVPIKAKNRNVNASAHINHVGCWYFQEHTLFP